MSKAFVKEENEAEEELDLPEGPRFSGKNYITPKGAKAVEKELETLRLVERPKIVETVSWAASNGDRSENGDYIYGKKKLREIDRRIRFLTKRMETFHVIDPSTQKSDQVLFGATVTVEDEKGTKTYQIVGIDETEVERGKISWQSPIGKALLGKKRGDVVEIQTPGGELELEIIQIQYGDSEEKSDS